MKTIKSKEISLLKMATRPPAAVVSAEYRVIFNGKIMRYVGIGWVEEEPASPKDYEIIPQVID